MLRDVFYFGKKPNVHPREQFAENINDARLKATTCDFWIINEYCEYRDFDWDFDFEFLPDEDVWAEDHNNVWPSQHQKDSGTWLCPKEHSDLIIYRGDVDPIKRKNEKTDHWVELDLIDYNKFDFSWHPDPSNPPYIYKWGCKFFPTELKHVLEYRVPNATQVKYMPTVVELLPEYDLWVEHQEINKHKFDMSWRPNPLDPPFIYVWGNKYIDGKLQPTLEYHATAATTKKYMPELIEVLPEYNRWVENILIDKNKFDMSWRPDPREPAYIYVWGNKYFDSKTFPTVEYHMPGATEIKHMDEPVELVPDMSNFTVLLDIDKSKFDFSWRPNPTSPPYIYVWGNQHNIAEIEPTVTYTVPGATECKFITDTVAYLLPNKSNYFAYYPIIEESFDFSWKPNPKDPAYIYVFGSDLYPAEIMPVLEYRVLGATEYKYMEAKVRLAANLENWEVPNNIDIRSFDFSWYPNPTSPAYIYEFSTVWNDRGGPRYVVPGASEYFYIENVKAKMLPMKDNWEVSSDIDVRKFDFSWVPHPLAPAYIYQFGTKLDNNDGPRYVTPNNNGEIVYLERVEISGSSDINVGQYYIETTLEDLINKHPNEIFWALRKNIDYTHFDFNWRPVTVEVAYELGYVHVFGSMESELTQTYFVSAEHYLKGKNEFKFVEELGLDEDTLANLFKKPDMFFIDRSNNESQERFVALQKRFPNIQKTRYLNSWVDTINRCTKKASTELIWVLNSELDYSDFDFKYYPNPWQMKMVHVFGTQWSHWGSTFLINTETFAEDTKYIKIIEHLSNLNFVKSLKAKATNCLYDIIMIDHGNKETLNICNQIESKTNKNITIVNYDDSYLTTFKHTISTLPVKKDHYVWICSSVCDYNNFDFSYICDPFTKDNLHVFPSGRQKFGDTFLVDVNRTRELIEELTELEEYNQVNYNQTLRVDRLEAPTLIVETDTLSEAVKENILDIDFPYANLVTKDNIDLPESDIEPMNLWAPDTKNIIITSTGASKIVIPKIAKNYVGYEMYDYPYIKRAPKLIKSNALDIVFLSNGETGAAENYQHLLEVTKNLPNRVVRVDGINGRAKAYHAAAEASNTPWFFAVFAKLKVNPKFDWSWQPDRMQVPKHYIFHAKNPVNGLTYGHQAMIAYNKKLTLGNEGRGLDFTLDDEHEVVPLISGTAHYNTDEFSTWRTAFREVIKLLMATDDDSKERLNAWLTKAEGEYSKYSIKGAKDAELYFNEVDGDFDKLKLSYEWEWLRNCFDVP